MTLPENKNQNKSVVKQTDFKHYKSKGVNTRFSNKTENALINYAMDNGYDYLQDVVRIAVSNFLKRTGYL